MCASGGGAA
jgi:actin-related protein